MFCRKKRSWYCMVFCALLFAGVVFLVSRFFMHMVRAELTDRKFKKDYRHTDLFI